MRGKLRDKRAPRRDQFKRDMLERKRNPKRDTRTNAWAPELDDEQYDEGEELLMTVSQASSAQNPVKQ